MVRTAKKPVSHYFVSPAAHWWLIIPLGLLINYLAWFAPQVLSFIPVIGSPIANFVTAYPVVAQATNLLALIAHLGEALYAFYISKRVRMSTDSKMKWIAQTFLLGYPSLVLLKTYIRRQKRN
ncbi:unnamed protein product [Auanema sp. JU1783]|nr:unnamed protein product [Auanema sp. JU1783]